MAYYVITGNEVGITKVTLGKFPIRRNEKLIAELETFFEKPGEIRVVIFDIGRVKILSDFGFSSEFQINRIFKKRSFILLHSPPKGKEILIPVVYFPEPEEEF